MSNHAYPVRPRHSEAPENIGRRVVVRELSRDEPAPGVVRWQEHPIDPERAPRVSTGVPGNEVPAPPSIDKAMGLDCATALGAVVTSKDDPCLCLVSARAGERRKHAGIDGRARGGCVHGERLKRAYASPKRHWQKLAHLRQSAD